MNTSRLVVALCVLLFLQTVIVDCLETDEDGLEKRGWLRRVARSVRRGLQRAMNRRRRKPKYPYRTPAPPPETEQGDENPPPDQGADQTAAGDQDGGQGQ